MSRLLAFMTLLGLLLVGLTLGSGGMYWQENEAVQSLEHTQTVLRAELNLLATCQEIDMSSRGYAFTRNRDFADRLSRAERTLRIMDKQLREVIAGEPKGSIKLTNKFDAAIQELISTSEAMKNPGRESEVWQQKDAMDTIRSILSGITDEETRRLQERRSAADQQRNYIWVAIGVQLMTGLGLVCAIAIALIQYRAETEHRIRILEEASKQEQLSRKLAEEALASKSRFLSTVSHEVRTPMAGIIGLAELLTLSDLGPDANTSVRAIFDSSKRLLQILNNVLQAAQLQAGAVRLEYRDFPVRTLIGDVTQLIAPDALKRGITVFGNLDNNIPEYVCGDELRVRQVLLNLAFNALKFTEKGSIHVKAQLKEVTAGKTVVRFSITDTGIGVPEEQQTRLFEPFVQVQDTTTSTISGAGLGLSICKNLVGLMGGEIGISSELGKGSTFWFDMPFVNENGEP